MCITDAFTKYVELVAIDNKEAATVAEAIFEKWFCRYGIPMEIVTDGGKEFCAKVSEEVIKRMGAMHLKTAPYQMQCNSQAEVANKTIADYLSKYVDQMTLDWELYIAPLMFAYNTSFHRSIQNTPHFLTFGIQARQPAFFQEVLNRKFYGENTTDVLTQRLQYARQKWGQRGLIMFNFKKTRKYKILIMLTKPRSLTHFSKRGRDWQLVKTLDSQNHKEGLQEVKLEE